MLKAETKKRKNTNEGTIGFVLLTSRRLARTTRWSASFKRRQGLSIALLLIDCLEVLKDSADRVHFHTHKYTNTSKPVDVLISRHIEEVACYTYTKKPKLKHTHTQGQPLMCDSR